MKKLLLLMIVTFIGGCASSGLLDALNSSDPEVTINSFDQSTTIRSAPATFYHKNPNDLVKIFNITSAQWESTLKDDVILNLSIPGWENIEAMQFNADGRTYNLRKLDTSTSFVGGIVSNGTTSDKLSQISFIIQLSSLRKLYDAQTVMVRVITLKREHFVSDFHRKGVGFFSYVDAYTVLKKFLAKLDEVNSQ